MQKDYRISLLRLIIIPICFPFSKPTPPTVQLPKSPLPLLAFLLSPREYLARTRIALRTLFVPAEILELAGWESFFLRLFLWKIIQLDLHLNQFNVLRRPQIFHYQHAARWLLDRRISRTFRERDIFQLRGDNTTKIRQHLIMRFLLLFRLLFLFVLCFWFLDFFFFLTLSLTNC